jgi:hypothetical protein
LDKLSEDLNRVKFEPPPKQPYKLTKELSITEAKKEEPVINQGVGGN